MQNCFRHGTIAFAVLAAIGTAQAQIGSKTPEIQADPRSADKLDAKELRLTEDQKTAIADAVRRERKKITEPPKFVASVGAPVPPAIELYTLPDGVLTELPAAKSVKYTVMQDQLVLVDPTTMRVVDIIHK
jgi:hypothetical protein